jgi:hypothetical protein
MTAAVCPHCERSYTVRRHDQTTCGRDSCRQASSRARRLEGRAESDAEAQRQAGVTKGDCRCASPILNGSSRCFKCAKDLPSDFRPPTVPPKPSLGIAFGRAWIGSIAWDVERIPETSITRSVER